MELDSREKKRTVFDSSNADAAFRCFISGLAQGAIKDVYISSRDSWVCEFDGEEGSCKISGWSSVDSSSMAIARVEAMRALSTSPSLHTLVVRGEGFTEEEVCELFHGLAANSCLSLTDLSIDIDAPPTTTTTMTIERTSFSDALVTNRTIKSLTIQIYECMYITGEGPQEESFGGLLNPWHGLLSSLRSRYCSIQTLSIGVGLSDDDHQPLDKDLKALADVLSGRNTSITQLRLHSYFIHCILPEEFLGMLVRRRRRNRLTSLALYHFDLQRLGGFDAIFRSLASNTSLESLDLWRCRGTWSIASILDSLQSNGRIIDVQYLGTPLEGEGPAIQAQLARNRAKRANAKLEEEEEEEERLWLVTHFFMDAESEFETGCYEAGVSHQKVQPTRCRLLLCGGPYAGKSTLAQSMKAVCERKKSMMCGKQPSRTQGIEMSKLAREGITVSLWDMAGQLEYHTIHDFMFPDLSNRKSPSFFLFVWNPIRMDDQGRPQTRAPGRPIKKTTEDFQQELRYWLRFITSKTRRSNNFRPVLLVAITRKDRWDTAETLISGSLNDLREQFEPFADIHINVFNVDARVASSVTPLTEYVFEIAERVLKSADGVLSICEGVLASISERLSNKSIQSWVTKQTFGSLCKEGFRLESDTVEAIALSLNDSGDLIYMRSIDFVVLDTEWFSHTLMGTLIHLSFENDPQPAKSGFVPVRYLECLLEDQMQAEPKKSFLKSFCCCRPQVALVDPHKEPPKELIKLLQGLHVACLEEDGDIIHENSNVFVPALLPLDQSQCLQWRRGDGEQFLGRRLRCRDSDHAFLTPGIFPLIQVHLHSLFNGIELQRGAAGFICDGVEVWVELAEDEGGFNCIDIMAKSIKDHDSTLLWVRRRAMKEIQTVCASDKGIQGVTLEEMVIRPACVRSLGISRERKSQCVSTEQLRKGLQDKLATESFVDSFKYAGFDWPSGDGLPAEWCCYIDLLGEKAAREICMPYAEKWYAAAKDTLGAAEIPMEDQEREFKPPESRDLAEIYKMLKEILMYERDTNTKVTATQVVLQDMVSTVDDLRGRVLRGMSEMLKFHKEMEAGRYPWMFVVTAASELNVRRVITAMVPGVHDWKLELLCENPLGEPHLPSEQPGLPFTTMEDGLLKEALPYVNTFFKLACAAVRVGAHAATGFAIPDFSGIINLPKLDDQAAPVTNTYGYSSRGTGRDAQQWLWNTLSKHGCGSSAEIYKKFKLQRVRRSNDCVVWVCDEHRRIGTPC